ncbi:hypothetical protein [Streptomyces platensis]
MISALMRRYFPVEFVWFVGTSCSQGTYPRAAVVHFLCTFAVAFRR